MNDASRMEKTEVEEEEEEQERTYSTEKEKLARGANKRRFASAHNERREGRLFEWREREREREGRRPNAHVTPFAYECALLSFSLSLRAFIFSSGRSPPPTPFRRKGASVKSSRLNAAYGSESA